MLEQEAVANDATLDELVANAAAILTYFEIVANATRDHRIPILAIILPERNLSSNVAEPDISSLMEQAESQLLASGLLEDELQLARASHAAHAISGTITRTRVALDALADTDGHRYTIEDKVLSEHITILRKIEDYDLSTMQRRYAEWRKLRRNYDVVVRYVREYFDQASGFLTPDDNVIRLTDSRHLLTAERLAYSALVSYTERLVSAAEATHELRLKPRES